MNDGCHASLSEAEKHASADNAEAWPPAPFAVALTELNRVHFPVIPRRFAGLIRRRMKDTMGLAGGRSNGLPTEEEQLLLRFAQDERAGFDEIVALYRGRVACLAYRLTGWDGEAEDVVQDVFLAALKNLKSFRGQSSLWTWLTRITVNKCHNLRRRRLLGLTLLPRLLRRCPHGARDPAGGAEDRETFDHIRRTVRALPAKLREVVVLRYLEEMPIEQVAEAVGASPQAVSVRLHRARGLLRERLSDLLGERDR